MNQLFKPSNAKIATSLFSFAQSNVYKKGFDRECTSDIEEEAVSYTKQLIEKAFGQADPDALLDLHRTVFQILTANFALHWKKDAINAQLPVFMRIVHLFSEAVDASDRKRLSGDFDALVAAGKDDLSGAIKEHVKQHPHNVHHPVFDFLEHEATFEQLSEFIVQEAPFDMLFGDIVSLMLPGIYDEMKMEILNNYLDEMGEMKVDGVHRTMRVNMMEKIGITAERYENIEGFCVEELALANMYMLAGFNRNKLAELIGMLLATEEVVPGRLRKQVFGWRRVGVPDENMPYLIQHISLDVVHASGWMDNVVLPLISENPNVLPDMIWGVVRRLDAAGTICDVLLERMKKM
ncbi:iron-containing redox enzyme family protein [Amylibacter sp. SFDW26]|uniref:iron-containing redox enzyme family protein n=1 Tax=Amylibacter sp. SFDW26 TaxID=2652722 RepID=UPI001869BC47|nr:iron-containing redox enzyme family protein [Amylibacter sp. SFDW26]